MYGSKLASNGRGKTEKSLKENLTSLGQYNNNKP
jgi:hypothetical protein